MSRAQLEPQTDALDQVFLFLFRVLCDGKAMMLLTLLFGLGFSLQLQRAEASRFLLGYWAGSIGLFRHTVERLPLFRKLAAVGLVVGLIGSSIAPALHVLSRRHVVIAKGVVLAVSVPSEIDGWGLGLITHVPPARLFPGSRGHLFVADSDCSRLARALSLRACGVAVAVADLWLAATAPPSLHRSRVVPSHLNRPRPRGG